MKGLDKKKEKMKVKKVKHMDEKQDMKLVNKMVKKECRK